MKLIGLPIQAEYCREVAIAGLLILLALVPAVIAETPDERAARIKAAQEALKQSQAESESPESLKARVLELEAENRKLRAQVAKLLETMKAAGIAVGADEGQGVKDAADPRKVISSFKELVSLLPDDRMPRREDRGERQAWTNVHKTLVGDWFVENADKIIFRNLQVVVGEPTPIRHHGEEGCASGSRLVRRGRGEIREIFLGRAGRRRLSPARPPAAMPGCPRCRRAAVRS